jgi:hypothetical protein
MSAIINWGSFLQVLNLVFRNIASGLNGLEPSIRPADGTLQCREDGLLAR